MPDDRRYNWPPPWFPGRGVPPIIGPIRIRRRPPPRTTPPDVPPIIVDTPPDDVLLPPVIPFPIPGVNVPISTQPPYSIPPTTGTTLGGLASRAIFGIGVGVIVGATADAILKRAREINKRRKEEEEEATKRNKAAREAQLDREKYVKTNPPAPQKIPEIEPQILKKPTPAPPNFPPEVYDPLPPIQIPRPKVEPPAPVQSPVTLPAPARVPQPGTQPWGEPVPGIGTNPGVWTPTAPAPAPFPNPWAQPWGFPFPQPGMIPFPQAQPIPNPIADPIPQPPGDLFPNPPPGVYTLPPSPVLPQFPQIAPASFADTSLQPDNPTTNAEKQCEQVKNRKRKKGKCRQGFFTETADSTTYTTWREGKCK